MIGGKGSGADAMIAAAGGRSTPAPRSGSRASSRSRAESLVAGQPDVILVLTAGLQSVGGVDGLLRIPGVAQTPAGQEPAGPPLRRPAPARARAAHRHGAAAADPWPASGCPVAELPTVAAGGARAGRGAPAWIGGWPRRPTLLAGLAALLVGCRCCSASGSGRSGSRPVDASRSSCGHLGHRRRRRRRPAARRHPLGRSGCRASCSASSSAAALAVAGAALQGVFRNPLADPGLIGVASGASVGAVAAIVPRPHRRRSPARSSSAAFVGGVVAVARRLRARALRGPDRDGDAVLTGVAVTAIAAPRSGS